jgi:hypothetical protein
LEERYRYCPQCGASITPQCDACGHLISSGWRFCAHCRKPVDDAAA